MEPKSILEKLFDIQHDLKVEKGTYNDFANFYYRSKEDILEAVKPLCFEKNLVLICNDEIVCVSEDWVYVVTTVTLTDVETGETISAKASAREPESKPKMDSSQVTGSASSYAGKRALGNLFAIDDTKDADAYEQNQPLIMACSNCGTQYQFVNQEQVSTSMCKCGCNQFVAV